LSFIDFPFFRGFEAGTRRAGTRRALPNAPLPPEFFKATIEIYPGLIRRHAPEGYGDGDPMVPVAKGR
jgi:hypothetical protein